MGRECSRVKTVSLVMKVGCTTRVAAKRLVCWGFGVSWVVGTGCGGVLLGLAVCFVALEVRFVVQSGAEQGNRPSSTMTWQRRGMI